MTSTTATPQTFGQRLRALRQEQGMTISELARRCDVGTRSIIRWEATQTEPRITEAGRVAAALETTLDHLAGLEPAYQEGSTP